MKRFVQEYYVAKNNVMNKSWSGDLGSFPTATTNEKATSLKMGTDVFNATIYTKRCQISKKLAFAFAFAWWERSLSSIHSERL